MSSTCLEPAADAPQQIRTPVAAPATPGRVPHTLGGADEAAVPLDGDLWVESLSLSELTGGTAADWDELSQHAAAPNVFYERWHLQAARQHLSPGTEIQLILIHRHSKKPGAGSRLCGLFPLVRERSSRLPLQAWSLFASSYGYLQTPLIRAGQERPVIEAFLDWASSLPGGPGMLDWSLLDGDGPIAQALADITTERRLLTTIIEQSSRAVLRRKPDWEQAAATSLSSHHRRELRRQHRRLMEQGDLRSRSLGVNDDLAAWQKSFLQLEQSGWKGTGGSAIAAVRQDQDYFVQMTAAAHRAGQLRMLGLFLDGEPIAMRTALLSGPGGFAWKIAYDEQYAKFSPGVQLEIENVRDVHEETRLDWMDSCATTQHFMINRIWSDRRMIQHTLISLGGRVANLAIGALPLARAIKRSLRRKTT